MGRKGFAIKILVYLTFIIVLGGVVVCVGYRARHPLPDSSDAYGDQQQSERIAGVQEHDSRPNREQREDEQSYVAKWFEPVTILTFLLVVGVAVTAYIYRQQLREMQKTVAKVGEQESTMKEQLEVMRDQATSTGGQLRVMRDTLAETRRIFDFTERPIIIAWNVGLPGFGAGYVAGTRLRPTVNFHNKGRTAAQKIRVTTEVAAKLSYCYPWGPPKTDVKPEGDYFLGGGDTMSLEAAPADAVAFDAELAKGILAGKESLLIHGKGSYEDLAGREWPIEFSFMYFPAKDGRNDGFMQHSHPKISDEQASGDKAN